jgi:hypothetical protein
MGRWDQNGSLEDLLGVSGVDSVGSGYGLVLGACEYSNEPLNSGATELVRMLKYLKSYRTSVLHVVINKLHVRMLQHMSIRSATVLIL